MGNEHALTVSNYLIENIEYFLKILRSVDQSFLTADLKIDKVETKVAM